MAPANKPRKGKKAERVPISWGNYTIKRNGKTLKVEGISKVQRGLFEKLGLPRSTAKETVRVVKDRRGRRRLKAPGSSIGNKFCMVSFNERKEYNRGGRKFSREIWYRVRLPQYVSLSAASILLRKAGKVKKMKFPNGTVYDFTTG